MSPYATLTAHTCNLRDLTGQVLDGVMRTLTPLARRGVVLERVVHDKLPPIVGDKRRLMQVLSNLVRGV